MSAHHIYELSCDAPRCTARYCDGSVRAREARNSAERAGWIHHTVVINRVGPSPSVDLCPEHRDLKPSDVIPPKPGRAE